MGGRLGEPGRPTRLVIVLDVFTHDGSKVPLADRYDVTQALGLDRPDETLGVGVQVRASRRQAQQLHVGRRRIALKVSAVQRIPVDDQIARVFHEAACRVCEVASDLRHPCPVGTVGDAGDVNATSLQIDDEEHEVANQPADRHTAGDDSRRSLPRQRALPLRKLSNSCSAQFPDRTGAPRFPSRSLPASAERGRRTMDKNRHQVRLRAHDTRELLQRAGASKLLKHHGHESLGRRIICNRDRTSTVMGSSDPAVKVMSTKAACVALTKASEQAMKVVL